MSIKCLFKLHDWCVTGLYRSCRKCSRVERADLHNGRRIWVKIWKIK